MDKEELLFEMFKDSVVTGTDVKRAYLQKKYPDINISNLHRRIVNYQVEKYGTSLNSQAVNRIEYKTRLMKIKNRKKNKSGK